METRVKERLVGAVIFVALIVALVPEILSGPQRGVTADAANDSEQPLRTYTIDLAEQGFPADRSADSPTEPTVEATEPSTPPAETATRPSAENARPTTSAPTRAASDTETGWAVQVGSFSSAENAERLAAELRARDYKAFVSRYESAGQARLRVRVGPEQERSRAEQLAARLRREGRQATVVEHP